VTVRLAHRRFLAAAAAAALAHGTMAGAARAEFSGGVLRVGLMTDFSTVYADTAGEASALAYQLAIEDFGGQMNGKPIEVVRADFQNKADLALTIARKWFDEDGVDVILDAPNSGIAVALGKYVADKNKVYLIGAVSSDLTNKFCTPNTVQFAPDTYSFAAVAGQAVMKKGLKTWYSITADYAMGHVMEADTRKMVASLGGQVVGSVRHPFGASDMSSFVLQAQASKAQVLNIASAGGDAVNIEKTIAEFGVNRQMQVVALNTELLDVYRNKSILSGMYFTEGWYWNMNDETRAWTKRYVERHPKKLYPSRGQAAAYAQMLSYLNAVKDLGDDTNGRAIVERMKATPLNNVYVKNGRIREDGRLIKEMYLAQVKPLADIKDWDLYNIVDTVPGELAFRPAAESECPLLRK
jgi:branched-chain amino acid transport system substrate-binding protein